MFERASHMDFLAILEDLPAFWSSSGPDWRTKPYHYPYLVHEFGDTTYVLREDGQIIAYLFGFVSQTSATGYIHLVGVRSSSQGKGHGRDLYEKFASDAQDRGATELKAVTAPWNLQSIGFHMALGFKMDAGVKEVDGFPVFPDYQGPGEDMIILRKALSSS